MSTPVGHSLIAAAILSGFRSKPQPGTLLFAIFAANAPDLDFLFGIPFHDPNLFHQGPSHSLFAVLLFGAVTGLVSRSRTIAILGAACYASHLLLDLFTFDGRPPYGIPLLWPFSDTYWHAPFDLFQGVRHGVPGDSLSDTLAHILSWHNARTILIELALLLPFALVSLSLNRRTRKAP